ncbi:MAG TPA: hypothetical protein VF615_27220 [Longimicrobiaceae bacterium]|jgi:lauroyl/myristoyl acyltransferase
MRSTTDIDRVAAYMRDLGADPGAVRAAIWQLGPDDLTPYGFDAYQLNLASLFGYRWSHERTRQVAAECARRRLWEGWACHVFIRTLKQRLAATTSTGEARSIMELAIHLRGWNESGLDEFARRGGIICSFHLGAFRHTFIDLMLRGYSVAQPFDDHAFGSFSLSFDGMYAPLRERVRFVNVEREQGRSVLAEALREGRLIVAFLDGNTGTDGPRSMHGRSSIQFGGYEIRVKHGLAKLAIAHGVPLIPLFAAQEPDGHYHVSVDEPIQPPPPTASQEKQQEFVRAAMQQLYSALETRVSRYPEQWESVARLHQWRPECAEPREPAPRERSRAELFSDGRAVRLDERHLVRLGPAEDRYWVDVRTLRAYRPRPGAEDLIAQLQAPCGVSPRWLASRFGDAEWHDRVLSMLGELGERGALVPV